MKFILAALKQRLIDALTPSAATLLNVLVKFEAKIERAIEKDVRKLHQLAEAAKALEAAIKQKDASLNASYKLLHKVSEIGK